VVRALADIRTELTEARNRRDGIQDDLDRTFTGEEPDSGLLERRDNLAAGLSKVKREVEGLEDEIREALAEGLRNGTLSTVPGEASYERSGASNNAGDPRLTRVRDDALRANERASFLADESRAHMETTIRADDDPDGLLARYTVEVANRDYFRAFSAWMRDPISGGHEWSPKERDAVKRVRQIERAMGIGTGGTGGFLLPYELDPSIIIAGTGAVSPLRQISRVATTAYNEKRFVTSLGVTNTRTPEATEQTDDSPALLQPAITCKTGAAFVPVSFELFEDSDIAQQVGNVLPDAKNVHEALSFTLTQSNGPTGIISSIVTAAGANIIATASNVLAIGDLYTNQAALPPRWRPNASWMMALPILNGYRQLAQASGLNYSIVDRLGDERRHREIPTPSLRFPGDRSGMHHRPR
jgi:HK97 family phage major capsid protein